MQPYFDVDRAQERDSSPVIFGAYVEVRSGRADLLREPSAVEAPSSQVRLATATPLPTLGAPGPVLASQGLATQGGQRSGEVGGKSHAAKVAAVDAPDTVSMTGASMTGVLLEQVNSAESTVEIPATPPAREVLSSSVQLKVWPEEPIEPAASIAADAPLALDRRVAGAWREWLLALARDPEAALAAAHAYQQLGADDRNEWLKALETDLAGLGIPAVAVYGPLLAVESDPQRVHTMRQGLSRNRESAEPSVARRALLGRLPNGQRVGVLVDPLYLGFVQVLACAYVPGQSFAWVRHDPIAADPQHLSAGQVLEGAVLESVPVRLLIDELARTIVSHRRQGGTLPDALCLFADLFGLEHMVGVADEWFPR
jgi:hypothetical protein